MLHQDPKLLAAYRAGQPWAYEAVYRHYVGMVERFLRAGFSFSSRGRICRYRGGHTGVDTESVVQETFARAFAPSTRANYDGERDFKNYLFSIAKNLVLRELQRRERVLTSDPQNADVTTFAVDRVAELGWGFGEGSPEAQAADDELTSLIAAFIRELNFEESRFFSIRFARGFTQEATAEEMGVTRARVKLLEKQLRRRFLECLREHGYFVGYRPKPRWSRATTAQLA